MKDFALPVTIAGIEFKNPFYVASGPTARTLDQLIRIERAGWAGASIKLSIDPKPYINRVPRYALFREHNALAFTAEKRLYFDQGLKLVSDARKVLTDLKVMANITYAGDDGPEGWVRMAKAFEAAGADIIEFNMCCPNMSFNAQVTAGDEDACERKTGASLGRNAAIVSEIAIAVKKAIGIPLFVKLTPEGGEIAEVAHALFQAGVDAVGGTGNRLGIPPINLDEPGKAIYHLQDEISMSCYSGAWLKPLAQRDTYEMRKVCGPDAAITATGGIRNAKDAIEMAMCGADLLGICSETLIRGYDFIGEVIEETRQWLHEHGHQQLRGVRDSIVGSIRSAPELTLYSGHARVTEPALLAPCRATCPAGVPIQTFMKKVSERKYEEAMAALAKVGPLQEVCGLLCDAPCEHACVKERQTVHLQIREMERFLARRLRLEQPDGPTAVPARPTRPERVLVREANLSGIMCAHDLLRQGYRVTIGPAPLDFYALLPESRLPAVVLESAQRTLDRLGVERLPAMAGLDIDRPEAAYDAIYQPARFTPGECPCEDAVPALDVLARRRQDPESRQQSIDNVLVIGNGLLAAETARALKADGCPSVRVLTLADAPSRFLADLENEQIAVISGVTGFGRDQVFTGIQKKTGGTVQYPYGLAVNAMEAFQTGIAEEAATATAPLQTDAGQRLDLSPVVLIAAGQQAADAISCRLQAQAEAQAQARTEAVSGQASGTAEPAAPATRRKAVAKAQDVLARSPYPVNEPVVRLPRAQAETGYTEDQAAAEAIRCLRCGCGEGCDICRTLCCEFAVDLDENDQITINEDKCVACGMCFNRCTSRNIEMVNTGRKL